MRRGLYLLAVAALMSIVADVMIAPTRTDANMAATKGHYRNAVSINGLHVALPESMKTFPVELVPLP